MIALAISGGAVQAVLERQPLAWLGKVSYSLYLTHNIVLLAVIHMLFGRVGAAMLLTVAVAACLLIAALSWLLVEAPAMWLGQPSRAGGMTADCRPPYRPRDCGSLRKRPPSPPRASGHSRSGRAAGIQVPRRVSCHPVADGSPDGMIAGLGLVWGFCVFHAWLRGLPAC